VDESKESLHTSLGDVKERMFAMQPSGRLLKSTTTLCVIVTVCGVLKGRRRGVTVYKGSERRRMIR